MTDGLTRSYFQYVYKPIDRETLRKWVNDFKVNEIDDESFRKALLFRIDAGLFWIPGKYDNYYGDLKIEQDLSDDILKEFELLANNTAIEHIANYPMNFILDIRRIISHFRQKIEEENI